MLNTIQNAIENFLSAYSQDLAKYSAAEIAKNYKFPCLILDDSHTKEFVDNVSLEKVLTGAFSFYKNLGISRATPKLTSLNKLTAHIVIASVTWYYYNTTEELLYDCNYEYTLFLDEEKGAKIAVVISLNEKEKLEEIAKSNSLTTDFA